MMMWAPILNTESHQVRFICALSQQVGMVDEFYDGRIRRQLHDDTFVLLLEISIA